MIKATKIAISLPTKNLEKIERIRKKLGLQRSNIINQAICFWLKSMEKKEMVTAYEQGYRNQPESMEEISAMENLAAEAFEEEGLE